MQLAPSQLNVIYYTNNAAVTLNCEYLVEQFSYETGLTTAQMAMPASFGPTYDFSPNGPWIMFPGDTPPLLALATVRAVSADVWTPRTRALKQ
ncbi:hypothetical protein OKW41_006996 [Paraburkholderia sp. UCT70]|uniref:hypothetical protein n=1 Tax=Paraburkholderia sp. UCT70 TaxID=2991068 RepID=UPI003D2550A8